MPRKGDGFIDGEMSVRLGFTANHFHVLKNASKPRFDYIKAFGGTLYEAYNLYLDEMSDVKSRSEDNYFWLADRNKISKFSHFLKDEGVYGCSLSFSNSINHMLFNTTVGFRTHPAFIRQKKILVLFEKFKEVNKDEAWVK